MSDQIRALPYAHSVPGKPEADWEPLATHLFEVADLASRFTGKFDAADWGKAAGLLHDIGKLSANFQAMLRGNGTKVDHSSAGARIVAEQYRDLGRLLAYVIAGHHAGLANGNGEAGSGPSVLDSRLDVANRIPDISGWEQHAPIPTELSQFNLTIRPGLTGPLDRRGLSISLFTRMVLSALIDADRLATDAFYRNAEGRPPAPKGNWQSLTTLKARLDGYMADKSAEAATETDLGRQRVQEERARILAAARRAALELQGLFSLTVPTGGGKTLASLSFALDHAVEHNLDRVIYVIPFTSIIEQTASVFRGAIGPEFEDHVIEHHSAFREDEALATMERMRGGESALQAGERRNFAIENWDAPIIVTTAVQFFESLFSNRPGRCRKLHNIAKSVVIFDEAQTLPLDLLRPTIAAIEELALYYKTTAVLCTATQPAINAKRANGEPAFLGGLENVREIIEQPSELYNRLARVMVRPCRDGKLSMDELVAELANLDRVLCIVGTRAQARDLFQALRKADTSSQHTFHLSALMCPAHRTAKLAEIRQELSSGACQVVATTVVEAGVDIDFPVVWRQMAGLDSIAQAAGRCNREGRLPREAAIVQLFEVEGWNTIKALRANADAARSVLRRHGDDPLGLAAIESYFGELYWQKSSGRSDDLDKKQILPRLNNGLGKPINIPFADIAGDYRLIEDVMEPVIVPWDDRGREAIASLGQSSLPSEDIRKVARRLQPFTVNVPRNAFAQLKQAGRIEAINPHRFDEQFMVLTPEAYQNLYSAEFGFDWSDAAFRSVESNLF